MANEVGNRTFEELAQSVYPQEKIVEEVEEPQIPAAGSGNRSMEELSNVVYPEKNPLYADVDEEGNVSAVIRERGSGRIIAQGQAYSDRATLMARSSPLPHADLTGIELAGKSMSHGNFHDSSIAGNDCEGLSATWADLRNIDATGANLSKANLGFSDLRGMKASPETDISGCNFTGCAIDQETYDRLIKCRGANSAKGLAVREMPADKKR